MSELLVASGIGYSSVVCCSASPCSAPVCWHAGRPCCSPTPPPPTLALAVLPESFNRPFAVPNGIAMIGLGISLWRDQPRQTEITDAPAMVRIAEPALR